MKKILFLLLLALSGLQLSAQAPILQKNDFFSNSKLRTWYGFNSQHQNASLDAERVISEKDYAELKSLRPMFRDTFSLRVEMIDVDGTQKIVNVSLVLASEFMCAVETWNTACGFQNGKIIVYMEGGCPPYNVRIISNQNGQTLKDVWVQVGPVEQLNLSAGTYKVIVDDSNFPVANNYTLNAAEVKGSSRPLVQLKSYDASCGLNNGKVESTTTSGVPPYSYVWNTGATTKDLIGVPAGKYVVTVSDANFCTTICETEVKGSSSFILMLRSERETCRKKNGAIYSNVNGGTWPFSYQWSNGSTGKDLLNVSAGNYFLTVTDAMGCTKTGMCTIFSEMKEELFYLRSQSCNPADTGLHFVGKYQNQYGCDSVVWNRVGYTPGGVFTFDTIKTSCIANAGRVDTFKGRTFSGCDSFHLRMQVYDAVRTQLQTAKGSCEPKPNDTLVIKSHDGCDSIYLVTPYTLLPKDIVDSTASWCKSRKNDTISFINKWGCESFKIVRYLVKPLDTVRIVKDTCYQGSKNSYYLNLKTKDGFCDSVVFVTLNVLKTDTIRQSLYVCGLKVSKQSKQIIKNHLGCDSLTILVDSLATPRVVTAPIIFEQTCDPSQAGEFRDTIPSRIHGCDSLITVRRVRYNAPMIRTTNLNTCDKAQAGPRPRVIMYSMIGCDSLYLDTIITYRGSTPIVLHDSIVCGSKNSETMLVQNFQNQYGCDSVVRQKVVEFPRPLLTKESLKDISAIYGWDGEIKVSASGGTWPYTFTWDDGFVGPWRSGLKGGDYAVTLSDKNGCTDSMSFTVLYFWVHPTQSLREVMAEGYFVDCSQARLTFINAQGHEIASIEVDATTKIEVLQRIDMEGVVWVRAECLSGISAGKFLRTKSTFVR